jgi:hypothetical protein
MKIGLSFSRCVADIVQGVVDIEDVLVIVARTDFDPTIEEQWNSIWQGYEARGEWYGLDHDATQQVTLDLWNEGKLHQPRKFGAYPTRRPEFWLEAVLPSSELERNPAAKAAWTKFQNIAALTNVDIDESYQ